GAPGAERPLRGRRGPPRELGVGGDDLLRRARHQVVVELLSRGAHGVGAIRQGAELEADGGRYVDEEAVAAAAHDERKVLVGELGARAVRVAVPDLHRPADQIEPAEALAASI